MDVTIVGLRVLRETAERGTFTAAAVALGYTQSAVSRQVAALERATGTRLFDRRPDGPRLTPEGRLLLHHARTALDAIDHAAQALTGREPGARLRLGVFASAGVALLPRVLTTLRRTRPDLAVTTRVSTTPALVRSLRAGALDLAVLTSRPPHRPPDTENPPLTLRTLTESALRVAVPADGPLADRASLDLADLAGQPWIATGSRREEPQLGAWPSLPGRPWIVHQAGDWATKLALVAAGCGLTTVPSLIAPVVPAGVRVLPVADGPVETRRLHAARLPEPLPGAPDDVLADVLEIITAEARALDAEHLEH